MISISSGRSRIRLVFLITWLCINTLFLLIFLNLRKSGEHPSRTRAMTQVFLHSTGRALHSLKSDYARSGYVLRKFSSAPGMQNLVLLEQSAASLESYDSLLDWKAIPESASAVPEELYRMYNSRLQLLRMIISTSGEKGMQAGLKYLQSKGTGGSNERFSALADSLHQIYRIRSEVANGELHESIGSTHRPFFLLLIIFNISFPLFYIVLMRALRKLEERDRFLESEIEAKAAELGRVYERITDSFIALDNDWKYTYINKNASDLSGLNPKDLIGRNIFEVFPDVVNEPFYHALHEAKNMQKSLRLELYYSKTDQWFEDLIYPTRDGISVYYHDITEKKKAQIALQESEASLKKSYEQFNLVAKATTDALWDLDMRENRIWGNQYFTELFRVIPGESISLEMFFSQIHPDDSIRILNNYESVLESKSTYWSDEFRFKVGDGNYRTMYNRAYLLYTAAGGPYRIVGAMQDITNLQLARMQLLLEKELSDSIINSLPGIFYLFNRAGHLYLWNRNLEEVSGYSSEEISRLHPLDFFPDEEKELLVEKISNVFNLGKDYVEAHFITKSRNRIPYYFNGMLINYEGEDCLVGVGIDITEKVSAHDELRELATHLQHIRENERTSIAREIHDQLGQQLTGLKMDISWLNKKLGTTDDQVRMKLNDIINLIDDTVKTVRRISTELRPSILDDLGLVAAMEWQSDEFEKRSEITVDFTSNVSAISLPGDMATGLFRIFQECLTNVSRHSEASHIEARLHLRDGLITLQVRDNGKGFEINQIGGKKTLGLLGMKERTLLMGGTWQIASKPGEGTLVEIIVPVPKEMQYDQDSNSR